MEEVYSISFVTNLAISGAASLFTFLSFINLFGTAVITTKVYASMLAMVSYIFVSAITQATQIMIGHLLGRAKWRRQTGR